MENKDLIVGHIAPTLSERFYGIKEKRDIVYPKEGLDELASKNPEDYLKELDMLAGALKYAHQQYAAKDGDTLYLICELVGDDRFTKVVVQLDKDCHVIDWSLLDDENSAKVIAHGLTELRTLMRANDSRIRSK